jgi:hypothetical protein
MFYAYRETGRLLLSILAGPETTAQIAIFFRDFGVSGRGVGDGT